MVLILLLGKEHKYIIDTKQKKFSCSEGLLDLRKAKIGKKIKTNTGAVFSVVQPSIVDLFRKCRRGPQIVTTKDASQIVSESGLESGWRCVDGGSGSGFLAIFLGHIIKPKGSVVTYEKSKNNYEITKKNIKFCGLEKFVTAKNKPIEQFTEKNLDLITLDVPGAENLVRKCHERLKPGGWLCVYSPHIEQQLEARKEMDTRFVSVKTIETILRPWTSQAGFTHPRPSGLLHTGFMTFGRKI